MLLPGRLGATTLGDVIGALYRERATGTLELVETAGTRAGRSHRIHMRRGLVNEVHSAVSAPRIGDILAGEGFIGERTRRRLDGRLAARPDLRCGELLVAERVVDESVISDALRHQRKARLDALFGLSDARIAFRVARRLDEEPPIPLAPFEFLHGRARSRDRAPDAPPRAVRRRDPVRTRALTTLGLDDGADRGSVQRAFRKLAARIHPDRFPLASSEQRALLMRRFAEVSAAYHELVA